MKNSRLTTDNPEHLVPQRRRFASTAPAQYYVLLRLLADRRRAPIAWSTRGHRCLRPAGATNNPPACPLPPLTPSASRLTARSFSLTAESSLPIARGQKRFALSLAACDLPLLQNLATATRQPSPATTAPATAAAANFDGPCFSLLARRDYLAGRRIAHRRPPRQATLRPAAPSGLPAVATCNVRLK